MYVNSRQGQLTTARIKPSAASGKYSDWIKQIKEAAWIGAAQRIIEDVGVTVVTLTVARHLYIRIGRHKPSQVRIVNAAVHVNHAAADLQQHLMVGKAATGAGHGHDVARGIAVV